MRGRELWTAMPKRSISTATAPLQKTFVLWSCNGSLFSMEYILVILWLIHSVLKVNVQLMMYGSRKASRYVTLSEWISSNYLNFAEQIKLACNWKLHVYFLGQPKLKATSFGIFEYLYSSVFPIWDARVMSFDLASAAIFLDDAFKP